MLNRILSVLAALGVLGVLAAWTFLAPGEKIPAGAAPIQVWHPWGGVSSEGFQKSVEQFNRTHPRIHARTLYVANDLTNSQKINISVAGGVSPDVTFVDGPQVAEWAQRGVLQPLDDLIEEAGIKAEDFWEPCWRQNIYNGRVYALTYSADPNFGFFWNKKVFRESGLDPEKPPLTLDEMDSYADQITRREKGMLTRVGIIPWAVYGPANSMFTWGWAFGGEFYDPRMHTITANHPRNVKALEWIVSYSRKYDVKKVSGLQSTFGSAEQNPFILGQVGMMPMVLPEVRNIRRYAPDLEYGVAPLPTPPGGVVNSSWVGGWCLGIPKGLKNDRKAGFEFIRWMCATPEGTRYMHHSTGTFPGYKRSPVYQEAANDPVLKVFIKILEDCKHQRPVMPAQAYYMDQLSRAVSSTLYGGVTPEAALAVAREKTQKHLDRVLGQGRR